MTLLISVQLALAQSDSNDTKLDFTADFRFRFEQDWNSRKSDGPFRSDRSRLRYRLRFGANYQFSDWASMGMRLRTGNPKKQQDPQLTLGRDNQESGTLLIGLEKAYFQAEINNFTIWMGKNTFPFRKQNELFWSDNVYPDGIFISRNFTTTGQVSVDLNAGHFVLATRATSLSNDSYLQGFQIHLVTANSKFELFPSLYLFRNIPNVPDGAGTYELDHNIAHLGSNLQVLSNPTVTLEADFYHNLKDLTATDSIPGFLQKENFGFTGAIRVGDLIDRGNWLFKVAYTYLEKYAAVDFLAQNDWTRWDYSSFDSPDGRLTNYRGWELQVGYAIDQYNTVNSRFFNVDQLVAEGAQKETGSRIRFDVDIGF